MALKKIINNKWLMLSLFSGILISVLIACTIPMYSAGISHRMLVTHLENYQNEYEVNPAEIRISGSLAAFKQETHEENFLYGTEYFENYIYKDIGMPAMVQSITLSTGILKANDVRDRQKLNTKNIFLRATNTYENAVELISGRLPSEELDEDGCVEVMISRATQQQQLLALGTMLQVAQSSEDILTDYNENVLKVKIVGVFDYSKNPLNPIAEQDTGMEFYCDYHLCYRDIFLERGFVTRATWYYIGDFTKFDSNSVDRTISAIENLNKNVTMWGLGENAATVVPPVEQYKTYKSDIKSVNVLLILFYAPIMILIVFFIFMIAKLVIENDKIEIAMLNSRGASRGQIVLLYLWQGGALALISVLLAPFIAFVLCNILGTTSGFLEFAQRAPIKLMLSFSAVICGILAAVLAVITMLVPVYRASKIEIIQYKRSKLKEPVVVNIAMALVAVLLTLISAYAYYVLVYQGEGLITSSGGVQPLAYLLLVSFFAAAALFFVILYPLVLKLLLKMRGKHWKAAKYSAFSRIARLQSREKFIVVFLVLTIAIGVFSSISARTLNKNIDDSTLYQYPCDYIADVTFTAASATEQINRQYFFDALENTQATKVVTGNKPRINTPYSTSITENLSMLAIDPKEYGEIVSWRDDILPKPLAEYLSMLQNNPKGCILSENAAAALGNVKTGDTIHIRPDTTLPAGNVVSCTVLAIVDAWPAYYPEITSENDVQRDNYLVVLNLAEVEKVAPNQPYQVWMNTEQNISDIKQMAIPYFARLRNILDGKQAAYLSQINSVRQATNGSLTLGFIAVLAVCAIGFAIYWVLSIKGRSLQIGTMRALGMPVRDVYGMILWEQILLCLASVLLGLVIGVVSGYMFAPLLQSAFGSAGQMPPLQVSIYFADIIKICVFILLLIASGLGVSLMMLKRINAASAIKLGEE